MAIRIGINGFGRIGRSVFRIIDEMRPDIDIVIINDLFPNDQLAYLLKYDTVMRVYPKEVTADEDTLRVGEREVRMTAERDPAQIPWGAMDVDVVVESTGVFTKREKLEKHLQAGAKKVILTTTGAARAVGKILPQLKGKLDGMAIRVPVPDGSIVDLVARLRKTPTRDEVNAAVRDAAAGPLRSVVEYSEVPLVSSDVIGNPHSSVFDALSTDAVGDGYVRVVSWYDNEWGYSNRVVDLIGALMRVGETSA